MCVHVYDIFLFFVLPPIRATLQSTPFCFTISNCLANHKISQIFTRNLFLKRKYLPKELIYVFLLAPVFFFREAVLINLFLKGFKEKVLC